MASVELGPVLQHPCYANHKTGFLGEGLTENRPITDMAVVASQNTLGFLLGGLEEELLLWTRWNG
jgi:hypothetical protein